MSLPANAKADAEFFNPSPISADDVANSLPNLLNESTMVMLLELSILNRYVYMGRKSICLLILLV
jgi:hypothetical protein